MEFNASNEATWIDNYRSQMSVWVKLAIFLGPSYCECLSPYFSESDSIAKHSIVSETTAE